MALYSKLLHHDVASSLMNILCYTFVLLNIAQLAIQDDASGSKRSNNKGGYIMKPEDKYKRFEIMYSLKSTWEVINNPQFSGLPVVKKIKDLWEKKKPRKLIYKKPRIRRRNVTTPSPMNTSEEEILTTTQLYETTTRLRLPGRQNPFVLVEGSLTTTRRKLTRNLMKHTTFMYMRTFPKSPFKYREKFRSIDLLRLKRAYVTLRFYLTARDLNSVLEERPVIMSGFWMRQAVEYLARQYDNIKDLPPVGSACYKWPEDLAKPDLVFFLHTPRNESTLMEKTKKRLQRIVEIYQRMDPPVIVLDDTYNNVTEKKAATLRKFMLDKLQEKFPFSYDYLKCKLPQVKGARKKKKVKTTTPTPNNTSIEDE